MSLEKSLRVLAIIQARLTSIRFPRKILEKIGDKTILEHCINRVKKAHLVDRVVLAVPHEIPLQLDIPVFYGDEQDVLKRYAVCAKQYPADVIVRITADCPFIDPWAIDLALDYFVKRDLIYTCFAPVDGSDVEVFTQELLEEADRNATDPYDREHVTPYMIKKTKCSIDTLEDLNRARGIYELSR